MAIDIGIGCRPLDDEQNQWTASLESMRTLAAVLAKAAGVAMTGRKATVIRLSSWGKRCLARLEVDKCSESGPGDRTLAAWARLLYITNSISVAFDYDDPEAIASVDDTKTQLVMNALKRDLNAWRQSCSVLNTSPALKMQYYAAHIYLREAILYLDHRPEDFKVPYRFSQLMPARSSCALPVRFIVDGLTELIYASHALLESFMSIEFGHARALPLGMFVRVSYACFVLTKLCISARNTQSQLFHFIDRSGLKADLYSKRILLHVRSTIGPNGSRLPSIFLNLLVQMREWCVQLETPTDMGSSYIEDKEALSGCRPVNTFSNGEAMSGLSFSSSRECGGSSLISSDFTVMTGTPASNFERFGNAKAVEFAARHGALGHGVDIEETMAEVKSAPLRGSPTGMKATESFVSSGNLSEHRTGPSKANPPLSMEFHEYADLETEYSVQMHQFHMWDEDCSTAGQPGMPILEEMQWLDPLI